LPQQNKSIWEALLQKHAAAFRSIQALFDFESISDSREAISNLSLNSTMVEVEPEVKTTEAISLQP